MFNSMIKLKLIPILLSFLAVISLLMILRLINEKNIDINLKYFKNSSKEVTKVEPKIFCMITTVSENHQGKAIHVKNTWAQRCDQFLFLSSANSTTLPAVNLCQNEDRNHLWCKTKSGLHYIDDNYMNQFDWLLKADDDSYIIMDNLRAFLSNYSPKTPLYFGCKFIYQNVIYMSGGAGYVLSREAVHRFAINSKNSSFTDNKLCKIDDDSGPEDWELGQCLQNFGVISGDTRDDSFKPRFFPFEPWIIARPPGDINTLAPWFKNYSVYLHISGPLCCSPTLISFHYVSEDVMYLIDFLLYNVKVIH